MKKLTIDARFNQVIEDTEAMIGHATGIGHMMRGDCPIHCNRAIGCTFVI